ncbi:hypothetical protein VFC49_10365 [Thermococcus sp. SY098]|uniref:hypothetical protein n=1 Tax=Thermococcus sp. SY098 TaxID=3111325 RepID=UPI002D76DA31|nr:hypothetical protein [Thermococcus sp. SY098]WRS52420.1 hypothetical protein VFC49_10365 [Thermococcus sp. SY098]
MKKLFALLVGLLIAGATAGTAMAFPFGANKEVSRTEIEKVFNEYHRLLLKGGWLNELRAKWLLFRYGIKKGKTVTYTYSFPKMSSKSGEIQPMGGEQIYLTLEVTPYSYSSMPDYVFVDYHWEWRTPDGYPATEEWGWRGCEDLINIPYPAAYIIKTESSSKDYEYDYILAFDGELIYTTLGAGNGLEKSGVEFIGTTEKNHWYGFSTSNILGEHYITRGYKIKDEIVEGYITIIYKINMQKVLNYDITGIRFGMSYEHTYGNKIFNLLGSDITTTSVSLAIGFTSSNPVATVSVSIYTITFSALAKLAGSWKAYAYSTFYL